MHTVVEKKATIVGGHGFVGQHLQRYLQQQGWECWVPSKNDPLLTERPLGYVFYCAGLTADYAVRSYDVIDAHVTCLNKIVHQADFISLVYLSSTRLYDSQPITVAQEDQDLLFNPGNPRHIYDLSKALGESICQVAGKGRAKIARLACVYQNQSDNDGFLPGLIREVIAHKGRSTPLEVNSSPHFSRDYVALDDVIRALVAIACSGQHTVYNVASGDNTLNSSIFAYLQQRTGVQIQPLRQDTSTPPARISIARLREEFDWQPTPVLQQLETILKGATCSI